MATHGGALGVCEEVIPTGLLDESSAFLESLRLAATIGKVCWPGVGGLCPTSTPIMPQFTSHIRYHGVIHTPREERPYSQVHCAVGRPFRCHLAYKVNCLINIPKYVCW